jgi:hypothetical protein
MTSRGKAARVDARAGWMGLRGGQSLARHAAFTICLLLMLKPPPVLAVEQYFPGLKLTLDVPAEWILDNVNGNPVSDPRDNVHHETAIDDLRDGDFAPLISFILPTNRSTFYPMIRFFALKRGNDAVLDRPRWAMSNALSEKRTAYTEFQLITPPRKFASSGKAFYFAEVSYTMLLDDGMEHGVFDQIYTIGGGAALIVVDVKTSPSDEESRMRAETLFEWIRFH